MNSLSRTGINQTPTCLDRKVCRYRGFHLFVCVPAGGSRVISSNESSSLLYSYLPPSVAVISPATLNMDSRASGYLLTVQGNNIGLAQVCLRAACLCIRCMCLWVLYFKLECLSSRIHHPHPCNPPHWLFICTLKKYIRFTFFRTFLEEMPFCSCVLCVSTPLRLP